MRQKLLDAGLSILLVAAAIASIYMFMVIKDLRTENGRLQQENAELKLDYFDMQIQRDEAIDAVWQEHNRRMMED